MKYASIALVAFLAFACGSEQKDGAETTAQEAPISKADLWSTIEKNNGVLTQNLGSDSLLFIANAQVEACLLFADQYKTDENAANALFYGAKAARAANRFQKAVSIYDDLILGFADYTNLAEAMFLKGFILDEDLNQKDDAKKAYADLIQKFPESQYAKDASVLTEQLFMSDEDLIKMFEAKNKNK